MVWQMNAGMVWQMNAEAFLCLIIPALCCFPVDWESWFHKKMRLCYTECGHIKKARPTPPPWRRKT